MDIQKRIKKIEAATGQPGGVFGVFLIENDGRIFSCGQEYTREQFENIKKQSKKEIVVIVNSIPEEASE